MFTATPEEACDGGDGTERFGNVGELLIVSVKASIDQDPDEGPFDDLATRQHLEPFGANATPDDLDRDVCCLVG